MKPSNDPGLRQLHEGAWSDHPELDNGSVSDTLQWCQLHLGHCSDVVPVRRHFEDPNRQDEIFMACQRCIRDLQQSGLLKNSKFAKLPCVEVIVPKGLSKGRKVVLSLHRQHDDAPSLLRTRQQSFEITLEPLQAKYLRALGLRVIPA